MKNRKDWTAIAAFAAAFAITCIYPPAAVICLVIMVIYIVIKVLQRWGYDANEDDDPLIM